MRVLYAADSAPTADLARAQFERAGDGVRLEGVATASQCLERLAAESFDLLLLDSHLPDTDGLDLLARLRAAGQTLPIVMVTGEGDDETAARALRAGASDYIVKRENHLTQLAHVIDHTLHRFHLDHTTRLLPTEPASLNASLERKVADRTAALSAEVESRRASEQRLRLIIEHEPECVKVLSPEGTLLEMNPAGLAMIEADSIEQVRGRPLSRVVAPEHRAAFAALHARVIAGGTGTLVFESVGLRGGRRWLETHAAPLREHGQVTAVLGITRDITDRRRAEAQLRVSESRMRKLMDANVIGVIIAGTDGRVTEANAYFLNLVGFTRDELAAGRVRWDTITPPEWHGVDRRAAEELSSGGATAPFEKEYFHKDGHRVAIRATVALVEGSRGDVLCLVEDITLRKQAEANLVESEERFRAIAEASPVGIFLIGSDGGVTYGNPAGRRMNGLSVEDTLGSRWIKALHPDERERTLTEWQAAVQHGRDYTGTGRFLHEDGTIVWWDVTTAFVRAGDTILGHVAMVVDITEQKQAAREIHAQLTELRRWQATVLGREDRVMELKREVNALLEAQHQPARYASQSEP